MNTEKPMRYLSLCSGIEAASVAWRPLGWQPVAFSEIEPFPCAVLAHHYPDVPNLGDMTQVQDWRKYRGAVDVVVGGTLCQGFSVSGKRGGMADPRSGLAGCYANLVGDVQPRWIVWENVPGVLSSGKGRDFGGFIRQLAEFGYGVSWRVLDAQYFGVPQRRRRVFVVGHFGDWRPAAAVLFEPGCLRRDSAPSRKAGEGGASVKMRTDGTANALRASAGGRRGEGCGAVLHRSAVRRLTPRECERLQGFPDDYTLIPYRGKPAADCADGPRYKALGNSMAVPVMLWIGQRIANV